MRKLWILAAIGIGLVGGFVLRFRGKQDVGTFGAVPANNAATDGSALLTDTVVVSSVNGKVEELKRLAMESFDKVIARLPLYGTLGERNERKITTVQRTNSSGGIKIEVIVQSGSYRASFFCGPVNTNGVHVNPFLPDGALLNQFESLYDGSDTRRKPEAVNEWPLSTGKWSEQEAIEQTLHLAQALGHQTNLITKYKVVAVPLILKDQSGAAVSVTPFYKVDLYKAEGDARVLGVEYRMGDAPPGKVTRWFNWPPIKVP